MRITWLVSATVLVLACGFFFIDYGYSGTDEVVLLASETPEDQEHPDETEGSEGKEHPAAEEGSAAKEHPVEVQKPITIESVALYLEGYAAMQAAEHGSWMKVEDDELDKTLKLKLDKIHRERLAKTAERTYFVCADFKTPEGKAYDLDFWVKETDKGLEVTETTVHKEEGKPRYNWVEKDGIWSRKPLND